MWLGKIDDEDDHDDEKSSLIFISAIVLNMKDGINSKNSP